MLYQLLHTIRKVRRSLFCTLLKLAIFSGLSQKRYLLSSLWVLLLSMWQLEVLTTSADRGGRVGLERAWLSLLFCIFFDWLECIGHSFFMSPILYFETCLIRTQRRAAVASRRATNLFTHLPKPSRLSLIQFKSTCTYLKPPPMPQGIEGVGVTKCRKVVHSARQKTWYLWKKIHFFFLSPILYFWDMSDSNPEKSCRSKQARY